MKLHKGQLVKSNITAQGLRVGVNYKVLGVYTFYVCGFRFRHAVVRDLNTGKTLTVYNLEWLAAL